MKFWLKDPKTDKPSVSLTVLMITLGFCFAKLLLAEMSFGEFKMGAFSGSDFGMIVSPIAALYWGRRNKQEDLNE